MAQTTNNLKLAYIFSAIIIVLATTASAGGLLIENLYRDNLWTTSQWRGNDIVTLGIAVPILIGAVILAARGSQRAQLIWMAITHYMLYNFAFYLFAAAFNRFFLIYVALFALSILTCIFALPHIDVKGISQRFQDRTPAKAIAGYLLLVAVCLGGLWIGQAVSATISGQTPQVILDSGHPTNVVSAIDLSLLVPFFILGGIWLWQRRPWGYILGTIMTLSSATYTLALGTMSLTADKTVVAGAETLTPLWFSLSIMSLIAFLFLICNIAPVQSKPSP